MSKLVEIERTYLAAKVPDLSDCKHAILRDVYFPSSAAHAKLRIRQKGSSYELTKKTQLDSNDMGTQEEENVTLTKEEFIALAHGDGREVIKTRHYLPYQGFTAEVDIFGGQLKGLVTIDFEFSSQHDRDSFKMPDFCLVDVTQEDFIAGGVLAGKTYEDILPFLKQYNYKPL